MAIRFPTRCSCSSTYLLVIILSTILAWAGVSVTEQIAEPVGYPVQHNYYQDTTEVQSQVPPGGNEYSNVQFAIREETIPVKSLLTIDGIRFIFTSFVANFQNFGVIADVFIAMMGAGVAEGSGLLNEGGSADDIAGSGIAQRRCPLHG